MPDIKEMGIIWLVLIVKRAQKENPAQKSRVCPIYPYTYEILLNAVIIL
jgi:hypothetical protein